MRSQGTCTSYSTGECTEFATKRMSGKTGVLLLIFAAVKIDSNRFSKVSLNIVREIKDVGKGIGCVGEFHSWRVASRTLEDLSLLTSLHLPSFSLLLKYLWRLSPYISPPEFICRSTTATFNRYWWLAWWCAILLCGEDTLEKSRINELQQTQLLDLF